MKCTVLKYSIKCSLKKKKQKKNKKKKNGGGGVLIYCNCSQIHFLESSEKKSKEVEAILVDIHLEQRLMSSLNVYKPTSLNNQTFTSEMCTILDAAISNRGSVLCLGDLNTGRGGGRVPPPPPNLNSDILKPQDRGKQGRALLDIFRYLWLGQSHKRANKDFNF